MMVHHATYGVGKISQVSAYGAMRKIKIRFATAGERTFFAEKATLSIVQKG